MPLWSRISGRWVQRVAVWLVLGMVANLGAIWMAAVMTGASIWPEMVDVKGASWPLPAYARPGWSAPTRHGRGIAALRTDEVACNAIEIEGGLKQEQMRVTTIGWPVRAMRGVVVMERFAGKVTRSVHEGAIVEWDGFDWRDDRLIPGRPLLAGVVVNGVVWAVPVAGLWLIAGRLWRGALRVGRVLRRAFTDARRRPLVGFIRATMTVVLLLIGVVAVWSLWKPVRYSWKSGTLDLDKGWVILAVPPPTGYVAALPPGNPSGAGVTFVTVRSSRGPVSRPWWGISVSSRQYLVPNAFNNTRTVRHIGIAMWLVGVAWAVPTAAVWLAWRAGKETRWCTNCGYDLCGLREGVVCPECGKS